MQLSPEQVGSVNLLLAAVQLAQKRGAFSLKEAHSLQEAINVLNPQEIDAPEGEQTEGQPTSDTPSQAE
jgi:hypothetical protein